MKRFLCVVSLLLALTFCCITATYAESIFDFSTMSTSDLVKLRDVINAELSVRNFAEKEVVVPVGEYIVGVDIPAGVYTLTAHSDYCDIEVYSNGKRIHNHFLQSSQQVGKLPLQHGQTVKIKYDSVLFTPYKGLGF